ncbi:unnamed protein product [Merluccius merluccius]
MCSQILPWALLLVAPGPLWAHPITDSAEMPYSGPVSAEDRGVGSLDELLLSEPTSSSRVMMCSQILPWALLLVAPGPLWAHPITDSAEMPYSGPVSAEDRGVGSLDELLLSEPTFPQQDAAGLRYAALLSSELSRDGFMSEKQSLLNPFSRFLGMKKTLRKRGGNTECFWKYCV